MRVMFPKVVIIGTGLIGGSLGLALKRSRLATEIVGVARRPQTLKLARRRGCITSGETDWRRAVSGAQLVILACPVHAILEQLRDIGSCLAAGCIVMDVGSTKQAIVNAAQLHLPPTVYFVGAHPLAGSEKTGPGQARSDLFRNCVCVVTPTRRTHAPSLKKMKHVWRQLGASVAIMPPQTHDRIVAYTSHMPHLLAAALMLSVPPRMFPYTAGGFRDMTRIAAGDEEMWRDIFCTNRAALQSALTVFGRALTRLEQSFAKGRPEIGKRLLGKARRARQSFPGDAP